MENCVFKGVQFNLTNNIKQQFVIFFVEKILTPEQETHNLYCERFAQNLKNKSSKKVGMSYSTLTF